MTLKTPIHMSHFLTLCLHQIQDNNFEYLLGVCGVYDPGRPDVRPGLPTVHPPSAVDLARLAVPLVLHVQLGMSDCFRLLPAAAQHRQIRIYRLSD